MNLHETIELLSQNTLFQKKKKGKTRDEGKKQILSNTNCQPDTGIDLLHTLDHLTV